MLNFYRRELFCIIYAIVPIFLVMDILLEFIQSRQGNLPPFVRQLMIYNFVLVSKQNSEIVCFVQLIVSQMVTKDTKLDGVQMLWWRK